MLMSSEGRIISFVVFMNKVFFGLCILEILRNEEVIDNHYFLR
jgi:hypothetical protein